jgi:hypothetical protein
MRDFPGDTGQIPSTTRLAVSQSPDIIPAGSAATPNYGTVYTNNFNGPYNYFQNLQQNVYNYIYLRAFNLFPSQQSGTVTLYYAPSSLLLVPSVWQNNVIPNANGSSHANLGPSPANAVAVNDSPFYWQPPPLSPNQGHYCLISQVITTQDPNPIPSGDDLKDFAKWVADHPGIAWRNVTVVTSQPAPTFSGFQGFQNPQPNQGLFVVSATCIDIPDTTTISLVCPTTGPIPPVNYSGTVGPSNQTKSNPKTNVLATTTTLPATFSSMIQLTATVPQGTPVPGTADITLSYYLATQPTDDVADIAIAPEAVGLSADDVDAGILLLLGDYTYEFRA